MFRNKPSALLILAFVLSCASVFAQEPVDEPQTPPARPVGKTFKLLRDEDASASDIDLTAEEVEAWVPGLKKGTVEVSLGIGFLNLNTTLLQHDQIIYKYNTDSTYWGDVELIGGSAFAPTIRLGYQVNKWFALEGWSGVSISEYSGEITNTRRRKNEPGAPVIENPPVGEFDAEQRSLITLQAGLNAVVYPLDIGGDASGRWHPFLTAGAGNMWYDMNSNYTDGTASALDLNAGAGIRLLVDKNISLRIEVLMRRNDLEWTPDANFVELNEGTTLVPLSEYPVLDAGTPEERIDERLVTGFDSHSVTMLHWTIGVQGSF